MLGSLGSATTVVARVFRATRHICFEKELFTTFKPVTNGEKLFMRNSTTSFVEGKVVLMLTTGKELTLNEVLYVPDIR